MRSQITAMTIRSRLDWTVRVNYNEAVEAGCKAVEPPKEEMNTTCQDTYTLTISSSFRMRSGSLAIGEKWQIQLLTDMHVGNAIPFLSSFSFLKTLLVSSVSNLSPNSHISLTEAPVTHLSKTCFNTPARHTEKLIYSK